MTSENYEEKRERMVQDQIQARGVKDERVLAAMKKVPRHAFVPENMKSYAYHDEPLQIGEGQTISQPYIVAFMTEALHLKEEMKVLEIGTGSGYQAAILAEIVREVYTVEFIPVLSARSQNILKERGYRNIHFRIGDGTYGWQEFAPYDAVIVTAAPREIPQALQSQLSEGGRMIIPVGETFQELVLISREKTKFIKKNLLSVRFVPLVSTH
jgi:protein-L-isoaspartate(D-aspartate) O-methyltransferase